MPQIEKIMSDSCSTQETTLKNAFLKKSKMAPHYPMITNRVACTPNTGITKEAPGKMQHFLKLQPFSFISRRFSLNLSPFRVWGRGAVASCRHVTPIFPI